MMREDISNNKKSHFGEKNDIFEISFSIYLKKFNT